MTLVGSVAANFTRDLDQNYALIASLAETLSERSPGPGRKALASAMGPSTPDDSLTAELDRLCDGSRLADLGQLDDAELSRARARLESLEHEVSSLRRDLQAVADAVAAEMTRREL